MHIYLQSKVASTLPVTEDQEKLLTEALNMVKKSSFEMKTCLVSLYSSDHTHGKVLILRKYCRFVNFYQIQMCKI